MLKSHKEHSEAVAVLAAPRDPDDCHHLLSLDDGFALVDWDTLRRVSRAPAALEPLSAHAAPHAPATASTATSGAGGGSLFKVRVPIGVPRRSASA